MRKIKDDFYYIFIIKITICIYDKCPYNYVTKSQHHAKFTKSKNKIKCKSLYDLSLYSPDNKSIKGLGKNCKTNKLYSIY